MEQVAEEAKYVTPPLVDVEGAKSRMRAKTVKRKSLGVPTDETEYELGYYAIEECLRLRFRDCIRSRSDRAARRDRYSLTSLS